MFRRKRWVLIFAADRQGELEKKINRYCEENRLRLISISYQTSKFGTDEACVVVEGRLWHGKRKVQH